MPAAASPIRLTVPALRAVFAIVALISQLMLGSLVLPDRADARPLDALRAAIVLCKSGPIARMALRHHHHQEHPTQETSCPLSVTLELPAVILLPTVVAPPPVLLDGSRMMTLPPARAPPTAVVWALRARGPPDLA